MLNFWHTRCPPCIRESPYLNDIVDDYQDSSNVVFIAVAIDRKETLDSFLIEHPFKYTVVPDGSPISIFNNIMSFPAHAVLDKKGRVAFSTVGYSAVTGYWIRKSIGECLKSK